MVRFREWLTENFVSANSFTYGGIDGIGPDIAIGKGGKTGGKGDDNNHQMTTDKQRAHIRSQLLARLGMDLDDKNANLYDQPDPYNGKPHVPGVDLGSNSPRGS